MRDKALVHILSSIRHNCKGVVSIKRRSLESETKLMTTIQIVSEAAVES